MAKIKRGSDVHYEAGTTLAPRGIVHRTEAHIQRDLETYILRKNVEKEKTEISTFFLLYYEIGNGGIYRMDYDKLIREKLSTCVRHYGRRTQIWRRI